MKGFARREQKTSPQKSDGIENGGKSRKKRNAGFGTSVAFTLSWKRILANVEFTSRHFAKRVWR
jgi:hypothetical protein